MNPPTFRRSRRDNHEFGVIRLRELPVAIPACDCPERICDYWVANVTTASWYNPDVECCCAIHLNTRRRATGFHLVGIGTLDSVLIQPREVYRTAIVRASATIVIAHNHPSGCPEPSEADIRATRDLMRAGEVLKIALVDHVIIGRAGSNYSAPWVSLRALGYFA